ncbi:MAG: ThuA domain-containing protein [Planctomycetota bacterium]|jgi:trehalose utilization protein
MKLKTTLLTVLITLLSLPALATDPTKVVFISGKPSHGPKMHEHRAGNIILAKRLEKAGMNIDAVVLENADWPANDAVLDDAATIVIFCTGHRAHPINAHLESFDKRMEAGVGVVMIHWTTEAEKGAAGDYFLKWMGGFCDLDWSVNPHWTPEFKTLPKHPITRGVKPFTLHDEWYYHMRFREDTQGLTPILSAVPGPDTLKRPDGARSGNPHVRASVAKGEAQTVAWAYQREDGGRGFGFTGGHFHANFQDDNFRTILLNAIAWTAGLEVPKNGVPSATPTDEEMAANMDPKPQRRRN